MRIWISIPLQLLDLYDDNEVVVRRYAVSTARNGVGEVSGSYQTPRGRHIVRAKIGAGMPENTVFVRRRPTGEIWTPELGTANPERDWILTRILWLSGMEPGFNRLGEVDTMRRYIYLHGSPDSADMGCPGSIGCVRMRNRDIVELFDLIPAYTLVDIVEYGIREGDWTTLGPAAGMIREAVFVVEQGVPLEMEYDECDSGGLHVIAFGPAGETIGTGRLLPDGHIGRLAVLRDWRGRGVGRALMCRLMDAARRRGMTDLALHAQVSVAGFYERLGFVARGEEFMEVGIPHVLMTRSLS